MKISGTASPFTSPPKLTVPPMYVLTPGPENMTPVVDAIFDTSEILLIELLPNIKTALPVLPFTVGSPIRISGNPSLFTSLPIEIAAPKLVGEADVENEIKDATFIVDVLKFLPNSRYAFPIVPKPMSALPSPFTSPILTEVPKRDEAAPVIIIPVEYTKSSK
jgi:hypothetical protein